MEFHQITPATQGGAAGSVRLLLIKNPSRSIRPVRDVSFERIPWLSIFTLLRIFPNTKKKIDSGSHVPPYFNVHFISDAKLSWKYVWGLIWG